MLGKLNIALGDVRNSKKAKKRKRVWSSTGQTYQLHTHWCFTAPGSLHLLSVPCCRFLYFSLQLSGKTLASNTLPDLMPSRIFFQRALWNKRHKELWKQASFSPIPPGTPVIPQGMYILMIGAISKYWNFFFQMVTHMLAHSLRKAHIKFYLFSILKYWKQLPGSRGWWWQGSSLWFHATTSPHVQSTAGPYVGLYSEAPISSLWDTELQSVPWESHNGATLRDGHAHPTEKKSLSWRSPLAADESFANIHTGELEICTTKMDFFTRPKHAP